MVDLIYRMDNWTMDLSIKQTINNTCQFLISLEINNSTIKIKSSEIVHQ
jgi:hypothetical protein